MKEENLLNKIRNLIPPDYLEFDKNKKFLYRKQLHHSPTGWKTPEHSVCFYDKLEENNPIYYRIGNFLICLGDYEDVFVFEENNYSSLEKEYLEHVEKIGKKDHYLLRKNSFNSKYVYYIFPNEI